MNSWEKYKKSSILTKKIKHLMSNYDLNISTIAVACDLDHTVLARYLRGTVKFHEKSILKIEKGLAEIYEFLELDDKDLEEE
jgi:hypothetical protein